MISRIFSVTRVCGHYGEQVSLSLFDLLICFTRQHWHKLHRCGMHTLCNATAGCTGCTGFMHLEFASRICCRTHGCRIAM